METETETMIVDGHHGIYVPQVFAENYPQRNCTSEVWETLKAGPYTEWYWESWETVLQNWTGPDGETLAQIDGDLFLVTTN